MVNRKITYKFTDTGHWLARCDHRSNVIELNRREYPRLTPMMRDYVWVHENVHLLGDVYDEDECNRLTDRIFISRAASPSEKRRREEFVRNSEGVASGSGIAFSTVMVALDAALTLGTKVYSLFQEAEDNGYYSLDQRKRRELLVGVIDASFRAASEGGQSAKQIFWSYVSQWPGVEGSCDGFLGNSSNYIARSQIAKYEAQYGFKFDQVLPVDLLAKPIVKYALIALAVVVVVLLLVKKVKKQ